MHGRKYCVAKLDVEEKKKQDEDWNEERIRRERVEVFEEIFIVVVVFCEYVCHSMVHVKTVDCFRSSGCC